MSRYEYKLPRKKQPIFSCFKGIAGIFLPKIRVVDLDASSEPVMFVGNHANKMGPFMYESFFAVLSRQVGRARDAWRLQAALFVFAQRAVHPKERRWQG